MNMSKGNSTNRTAAISVEQSQALLAELEEVAVRRGVTVRYEKLAHGPVRVTHGTCRVHEQDLIIIDSRMGPAERVSVLSRELRRFDLENVFVPPAVRSLLDAAPRDEGGVT
ncbi:MAG: hypothetical protein IT350_16650 [Deltaproteobacteria bacterium]|nr:hypothetical protein [Deltaproteobacteria bacterium]